MIINFHYDRERDRPLHANFLKERMAILGEEESQGIRKKFIDYFVNQSSGYFKKYISQSQDANQYYVGYLWDSLKEYKRALHKDDLIFLDAFLENRVYVMCDLHSLGRLGNSPDLLPFFPSDRIGAAKLKDVISALAALPQDVYIFDDTFSWYLILTHEFDELGPEIYYRGL